MSFVQNVFLFVLNQRPKVLGVFFWQNHVLIEYHRISHGSDSDKSPVLKQNKKDKDQNADEYSIRIRY